MTSTKSFSPRLKWVSMVMIGDEGRGFEEFDDDDDDEAWI